MSRKTSKSSGQSRDVKRRRKSQTMPATEYQSPGWSAPVREIMVKAGRLYYKKQFPEAIALIRRLDDDAFKDREERLNYYRMLAFALANAGKFADAEIVSEKALQLSENDCDFHFVLSFVTANYKDYDRSLMHGQRFLEYFEEESMGVKNSKYMCNGHLHLLYNYLGVAWRAKNDFAEAEKAFLKAIELNQTYNHPYLNLAALYQRQKKFDLAEQIIEQGLRKCSQVQELRILKKSLESRATVSACMMVKNEEELLPGCLDSIRHWVDEIIIVDTGSTDRTEEIARSYGAKVYSEEWSKDFSKHRNSSISKATGDWIFIIDADEEFDGNDLPALRQAINQNKYRLISINVFNVDKKTGECTSFLPSIRLFKRDAGYYYEGIVHNQLKFDPAEVVLRAGISIRHFGYNLAPEKKAAKVNRSRELLEKQLATAPDDPFVHFNYAQLLRGITTKPDKEICELIIKHAGRAVELTSPKNAAMLPIHLQGLHQQATVLIHLGRYDEAEKLCLRALELKPDYFDAIFSLGEIYGRMQKFDRAEEYFHRYLIEQKKYNPSAEQLSIILVYGFARHRAYYSLGLIKQLQMNPANAEEFYLKALEEIEPYLDTYLKLAAIYLDRNDSGKALFYIEKELARDPDSDLANLYKARYYELRNDLESAEGYFEKAVGLTEGRPEVFERAGLYWMRRGDFLKAIPLLEKLVQAAPECGRGLKYLSKACFDSGDYGGSLTWYGRYLETAPDDAEAINDMANCHFNLGEYEKAGELYARALKINDKLAASYRNLGLTWLRLGKLREALPLLETYTEIAPDDFEVELAIGSIYSQSGDYSGALQHFEKYLRGNPASIEALFGISECYYHLGYIDSAAIGYSQTLKRNPNFQPAKNRLAEIEAARTPV